MTEWNDDGESARTFAKSGRSAPPEAVFYFRVCAGVWGFLQRCGIRGNWYRVGQDLARRRGRM